jgi:hypothetical protein
MINLLQEKLLLYILLVKYNFTTFKILSDIKFNSMNYNN